MTRRLATSCRLRILRAIHRSDVASNADVRAMLDIPDDRANRVSCELRVLRSRGWVERIRGGQGANDTAYRITEAGKAVLR